MNLRIYTTVFFLFMIFATHLQAQHNETVIYQTFKIDDQISKLQFDFTDDYELIIWNGANIMVETSITIDGITFDILKIMTKDGRYKIVNDNEPSIAHYKNAARLNIKNGVNGIICKETVSHRIYIPEEYRINEKNTIVRRDDITADARSKN